MWRGTSRPETLCPQPRRLFPDATMSEGSVERRQMLAVDAVALNEDSLASACRVLALHMPARIFSSHLSSWTHAAGPKKAEAEAVHDFWQ